jgi:hypothetical protein
MGAVQFRRRGLEAAFRGDRVEALQLLEGEVAQAHCR